MNIVIKPSKLKSDKTIKVLGHKHSFVQLVAATIIFNTKCTIHNVPKTDDTDILCKLIVKFGGKAVFKNNTVYLDTKSMKYKRIDENLCNKIHGALYFIFALAIRFHKFSVVPTGGCNISTQGVRPYNHLIDILNTFGVTNKLNKTEYSWKPCKKTKIIQNIKRFSDSMFRLTGEKVSSATKLCILAAIGTENTKTIIKNYYFRTDVHDLLNFAKLCGIYIKQTPNRLVINTENKNIPDNIVYTLSDCQSEVMTFITLAIVNNIKLTILVKNLDVLQNILYPELKILQKIGVNLILGNNKIIVPKQRQLSGTNITITHKGIQSDHQPFIALLLSFANGESVIKETVWRSRFAYVPELNKLGYSIKKYSNKIIITPRKHNRLQNNVILNATDTRAAAILCIAAVKSGASVTIKNAEHLTRGYDGFIENLIKLGAKVTK